MQERIEPSFGFSRRKPVFGGDDLFSHFQFSIPGADLIPLVKAKREAVEEELRQIMVPMNKVKEQELFDKMQDSFDPGEAMSRPDFNRMLRNSQETGFHRLKNEGEFLFTIERWLVKQEAWTPGSVYPLLLSDILYLESRRQEPPSLDEEGMAAFVSAL